MLRQRINDGSSSTKTNKKKELFLMKSAPTSTSFCSVMSLEEPQASKAQGLKKAWTILSRR